MTTGAESAISLALGSAIFVCDEARIEMEFWNMS